MSASFPSLRGALRALLLCVAALSFGSACASDGATLRFGGYDRTYRIYRPASVGSKPVPLVVALHGGFGTGQNMEDQTGFDALADRYGFIVVYPDGVRRAWNAGTCCATPMKEKIDDVGFVRAVIAEVESRYPIDRTRVYGTGFSNGAMLLHRIACEAPDTFVAIAPVSGGPMVSTCNERTPIPTLLIQGIADPRIPWNGGVFDGSYRPSIKDIVSRFGKRNECSTQEQQTYDADGVQCHTLGGCRSGDEVSWCGLTGAGHQWPGGKTYVKFLLGANNERFNASQKIWTFFTKYRKKN
jgi:polyhydroxybutyrate depolymerase